MYWLFLILFFIVKEIFYQLWGNFSISDPFLVLSISPNNYLNNWGKLKISYENIGIRVTYIFYTIDIVILM